MCCRIQMNNQTAAYGRLTDITQKDRFDSLNLIKYYTVITLQAFFKKVINNKATVSRKKMLIKISVFPTSTRKYHQPSFGPLAMIR